MDKQELKKARCEGYTVISAAGTGQRSPLIDMNGEVVHEWSFNGPPVKMLPGGSLLGPKRNRLGKHPLKQDSPPPERSVPPGGVPPAPL